MFVFDSGRETQRKGNTTEGEYNGINTTEGKQYPPKNRGEDLRGFST